MPCGFNRSRIVVVLGCVRRLAGLGRDLDLHAIGGVDGDLDHRRFGRFLGPLLVFLAEIGPTAVDLEPDRVADGSWSAHPEAQRCEEDLLQSGKRCAPIPYQDRAGVSRDLDVDDQILALEGGGQDAATLDLLVWVHFCVFLNDGESFEDQTDGCERFLPDVLHGVSPMLVRAARSVCRKKSLEIFRRTFGTV